jgi:hypothetical protein
VCLFLVRAADADMLSPASWNFFFLGLVAIARY